MFITEISAINLGDWFRIVFWKLKDLTEMWMETITCTCRHCSLQRGLSAPFVFFNKSTSPQLSAYNESKCRSDLGQISLPLFCFIYESWARNLLRNLLLNESHDLKFFSKTKGLVVHVKLTVVFRQWYPWSIWLIIIIIFFSMIHKKVEVNIKSKITLFTAFPYSTTHWNFEFWSKKTTIAFSCKTYSSNLFFLET